MGSYNTPYTTVNSWYASIWSDSSPAHTPWVRNGPGSLLWGNNVKNAVSNPYWRNKILAGQDATTPYSISGYDVVPGYLYGRTTIKTSPDHLYCEGGGAISDCISLPISGKSHDVIIRDQAIGRLRNRINSEGQSFNSLVPLGEIHELRELLGHGPKSAVGASLALVKELLKIKNGRFSPRKAFKAAQNAWLTFSFGIKPTLSDISSVANAIDAYYQKPSRTCRFSGSAHKHWVDSSIAGSLTGLQAAGYFAINQLEYQLDYNFKAAQRFSNFCGNDYSLLDQLGFNIPNLVPTAWELIPYTWLVDYFTTAGQFFEDNFTSIPGETVFCSESRSFSCVARGKPEFYQNSDPNVIVETLGARDFFARYYEFERTSSSTIPARAFHLKSVDQVGINGVNRLLNLTALLRF
jgi:hypothetical protein